MSSSVLRPRPGPHINTMPLFRNTKPDNSHHPHPTRPSIVQIVSNDYLQLRTSPNSADAGNIIGVFPPTLLVTRLDDIQYPDQTPYPNPEQRFIFALVSVAEEPEPIVGFMPLVTYGIRDDHPYPPEYLLLHTPEAMAVDKELFNSHQQHQEHHDKKKKDRRHHHRKRYDSDDDSRDDDDHYQNDTRRDKKYQHRSKKRSEHNNNDAVNRPGEVLYGTLYSANHINSTQKPHKKAKKSKKNKNGKGSSPIVGSLNVPKSNQKRQCTKCQQH